MASRGGLLIPPITPFFPLHLLFKLSFFYFPTPKPSGSSELGVRLRQLSWIWGDAWVKQNMKNSICPPFYLPGVIVKIFPHRMVWWFSLPCDNISSVKKFFPISIIFKLHSVCFNFYPFRVTEATYLVLWQCKSCIMMLPLTTSAI